MAYKLFCSKKICYFCGRREVLKKPDKNFRSVIEVHHIREKFNGGLNNPKNLIACCSTCHSLIHNGQIKIDKWMDVGYTHKLLWYDEEGKQHFGTDFNL